MKTINIAGVDRSPLLIHYGQTEYLIGKFSPVKNGEWVKPEMGGLWTSPVDSSWGWKDWNDSSEFMDCDKDNSITLQLKEGSKVLVIDSLEDLKNAPLRLTNLLKKPVMDFELISQDYDAIWLTSKGETKTRMGYPLSLYGWDCESVLILNPNCCTQVK